MSLEGDSNPQSSLGWRREVARFMLLMGAAGFLLVGRLGEPLLEPEEARYAEIPRQMLREGRLLVPVLDGQPYLDKPPLLYWAVMASYAVFGVQVWSARLVPCLAACLTVIVVYGWVRRTASAAAAAVAASVLLLSGDFVYRGPMLTMNGLLGLFVAAGLAAGHAACSGPKWHWGWWLASALACGAGVLTKGLVAAALIVVPVTLLLCLRTGVSRRGVMAVAVYLAAASLLAGPWFIAVASHEPGFADYFFWRHHVQRFVTPFDHAKPAWFYLPQLLVGIFPWSLALALTMTRTLLRLTPSVPAPEWFALAAAVWGLAFFSLSGAKRPVYLVPVWPPLAVAVGVGLHSALAAGARATLLGLTARGWRWVGGATFGVLAAGLTLWLPVYDRRFSVPRPALVEQADTATNARPVFCYPHGWPSVGFYLGRDDVRVFGKDGLPQLLDALGRCPEALLVIRSGPVTEKFVRSLPPELKFEPRGQNELVTVGIVRQTKHLQM